MTALTFSVPGIAMMALLAGAFCCLYRVGMGPSAPDRTVAIDILGTLMVGFTAILTVLTGNGYYLSIGITWALVSFIGTIALSKYLEERPYDD